MQAATEDERGGKGPVATPYALALAAVMSVESPFVHIDTLKGAPAGGEGEAKSAEALAAKRLRERQQQHARAAHAPFRDPRGDALSALRVLCAYLAAGSDDGFCRHAPMFKGFVFSL